LGIIAVTCLMTTSVGLLCSACARRTSVAMILTYLVLLLLFAAPIAVRSYLRTYTDIADEALVPLTITSPFAAAQSITIPARSGVGGEIAEPAAPEMANLPWIGWPLWAVYLVLNPVFAVVINLVTYVVFRIRWWRAGVG
jgi:hypothetical protein